MAPSLQSITDFFSLIPTRIWDWLKSFVKRPTTVYSDPAFRLTTTFLPALIVVLICLNFSNQFFRGQSISCTSSLRMPSKPAGDYSSSGAGSQEELETYCWNHGTFLVRKALQPSMRGQVTYPGVWSYNRGVDTLVYQTYYTNLWIGLGISAVLAFAANYMWKVKGKKRVNSVLKPNVQAHASSAHDDAKYRAELYCESLGHNGSFGRTYLGYKMLSALMPMVILFFLRGFIGSDFSGYGVDMLNFWMEGEDSWPNPQDVLFPLVAKCEWSKYGVTGDIETESAQCQLPMNNVSRYSLLILWWFLHIALIFSIFHLVFFLRFCLAAYRRISVRRDVAQICGHELTARRKYRSPRSGKVKVHKLSDLIRVHLDFGDWLLLNLLKKNMSGIRSREFLWKIATLDQEPELQKQGLRLRTAEELAVKVQKKESRLYCFGMPRYIARSVTKFDPFSGVRVVATAPVFIGSELESPQSIEQSPGYDRKEISEFPVSRATRLGCPPIKWDIPGTTVVAVSKANQGMSNSTSKTPAESYKAVPVTKTQPIQSCAFVEESWD